MVRRRIAPSYAQITLYQAANPNTLRFKLFYAPAPQPEKLPAPGDPAPVEIGKITGFRRTTHHHIISLSPYHGAPVIQPQVYFPSSLVGYF